MSAGFARERAGEGLSAVMGGGLVVVMKLAASAGVKSTFSAWPGLAFSFVPAAGVYPKLPATSAVGLDWDTPGIQSRAESAGLAQLVTEVPLSTLMETVLVAVL